LAAGEHSTWRHLAPNHWLNSASAGSSGTNGALEPAES
jgi:hypothetical protein